MNIGQIPQYFGIEKLIQSTFSPILSGICKFKEVKKYQLMENHDALSLEELGTGLWAWKKRSESHKVPGGKMLCYL